MKTLLLIDAYAIIHRAYFALPPLSTKSGIPTNAIYGFFAMLQKAISDFQPQYMAVCFDTPKPTFRKEMFKEYQAHRPKAEDGFKVQIPIIKELIDKAGIARLEKEGFEADDVIGTLATRFKSPDLRVLILTGDKDMMQLVDENVYIVSPQTGISTISIYTPDDVLKRFGIPPNKIPDFKGLMGDPSDNYPGAKGIGPKTATKLLLEYDTVEHILEHKEEVQPDRVRELIKTHAEDIQMSKKLATILTDVDVQATIEDCKFDGLKPEMKDTLLQYELYSLSSRLFNTKKTDEKPRKKKDEEKSSDPQLDLFS